MEFIGEASLVSRVGYLEALEMACRFSARIEAEQPAELFMYNTIQ